MPGLSELAPAIRTRREGPPAFPELPDNDLIPRMGCGRGVRPPLLLIRVVGVWAPVRAASPVPCEAALTWSTGETVVRWLVALA